jgi:hypothetical protein
MVIDNKKSVQVYNVQREQQEGSAKIKIYLYLTGHCPDQG